jgi:site-specific DNA-methyltransferase (adenine-specific)
LLLTDPPYGIGWKRGSRGKYRPNDCGHSGIVNDENTDCRDEVLAMFGNMPGLVFGSFYAPAPENVRQVLVYHKPPYSGLIGAVTPFRRDAEPIYLVGDWKKTTPVSSSVIHAENGLNGSGQATGHPHTKPLFVIRSIIRACPDAKTILDPFAGSCTTGVAAKLEGRHATLIEISERYCEIGAERLRQGVLF